METKHRLKFPWRGVWDMYTPKRCIRLSTDGTLCSSSTDKTSSLFISNVYICILDNQCCNRLPKTDLQFLLPTHGSTRQPIGERLAFPYCLYQRKRMWVFGNRWNLFDIGRHIGNLLEIHHMLSKVNFTGSFMIVDEPTGEEEKNACSRELMRKRANFSNFIIF
jgi:hypothetical protein